MSKILCLCNHNMNTTRFVAKDPDTKLRIYISVKERTPVLIDERIADKYPTTFTKIPVVAKALPQVVEDIPEPDTSSYELEIVEREASHELQELPEIPEKNDSFIKKQIEGLTKKELDKYAEELGVKLDKRKTLKVMKATLLKALEF